MQICSSFAKTWLMESLKYELINNQEKFKDENKKF